VAYFKKETITTGVCRAGLEKNDEDTLDRAQTHEPRTKYFEIVND